MVHCCHCAVSPDPFLVQKKLRRCCLWFLLSDNIVRTTGSGIVYSQKPHKRTGPQRLHSSFHTLPHNGSLIPHTAYGHSIPSFYGVTNTYKHGSGRHKQPNTLFHHSSLLLSCILHLNAHSSCPRPTRPPPLRRHRHSSSLQPHSVGSVLVPARHPSVLGSRVQDHTLRRRVARDPLARSYTSARRHPSRRRASGAPSGPRASGSPSCLSPVDSWSLVDLRHHPHHRHHPHVSLDAKNTPLSISRPRRPVPLLLYHYLLYDTVLSASPAGSLWAPEAAFYATTQATPTDQVASPRGIRLSLQDRPGTASSGFHSTLGNGRSTTGMRGTPRWLNFRARSGVSSCYRGRCGRPHILSGMAASMIHHEAEQLPLVLVPHPRHSPPVLAHASRLRYCSKGPQREAQDENTPIT